MINMEPSFEMVSQGQQQQQQQEQDELKLESSNAQGGVEKQTEEEENQVEEEKGKEPCLKRFKAWLLKWHLPLMLIFAIFLGAVWPAPGKAANNADLGGICFTSDLCVYTSISSLCVTIIFIISGLKLKTDAITKAITAWQGSLLGFVSILFITTSLSFALITGQYGNIPEFAIGLALFASVPTTLSSGVVIVGQAQGNIALALMLTVVTNIIGVFTTPLFVSGFLSIHTALDDSGEDSEANIKLDPVPLIIKLIFTILVPLAFGKLLQTISKHVRKFVKRFGVSLKLFSSFLLAMIPWMKISDSADSLKQVDAASFFAMFFTGLAMHLLYLVGNYLAAAKALKLALPEQVAVVIVASQKTLPVAITILDFLPTDDNVVPGEPSLGSAGLIAIPMIVAHLTQILVDSVVATKYAAKMKDLPS